MPEVIRPKQVGRVIIARETSYPDPLEVMEGEEVSVGECDEKWSGFHSIVTSPLRTMNLYCVSLAINPWSLSRVQPAILF